MKKLCEKHVFCAEKIVLFIIAAIIVQTALTIILKRALALKRNLKQKRRLVKMEKQDIRKLSNKEWLAWQKQVIREEYKVEKEGQNKIIDRTKYFRFKN